jgi:threonine dehydratase
MEREPAMVRSVLAGRPVPVREEPTLADSLMGSIGLDNRHTLKLVQDYVDDFVLLSEEEIADAMVFALRAEHLVVEGGGAVALGALLAGKVSLPGCKVAVVISGGNVDSAKLISLLATA